MHENFTSLVFFTVLSQTAVGTLIFRELFILRGGFESDSTSFRKKSLFTITILLILSLSIAFLHLGYPLNAFNALNNIGKSWLSREIFALSMLITTLLLYLIIVMKNISERIEKILSFISLFLCISLIFCMIKLYMIPSVIPWNHPFTPVSFIITTLLCGIVLLSLILNKNDDRFISTVKPFIAVLIFFSLVNSILFPGTFVKQGIILLVIRILLSVVSIIILFREKIKLQSNKTVILWVILFLILFSSEILNRYIFFLSFDKHGL